MRTGLDAVAVRLAFFYAAAVAVIGVQLPFFPAWLEGARGLGPEAIGWILAAGFWPRIVATLLITEASDRLGERRRLMIGLSALTVAGVAMYAVADGFWPLLLLSALTGITFSAVLPLGEALTLHESGARGLSYGRLRLWGSISFILVAIGAGRLIELEGVALVLPVLFLTVAATLVACLMLPAVAPPRGGSRLRLRALLGRPGFVRFVAATALLHSSHSVYYGFGTIHWRAAGHSETIIGWLWAEGVIAEIVLFALVGQRPRLDPLKALAVAGALTVVRWAGTALGTELALLVVLQILHAASFGVCHLAAMHYIRDAVPAELQASAQGWHTSASALLFGVLTPASGWLFGAFGGGAFWAMAGIAALAGALAASLVLRPAAPKW